MLPNLLSQLRYLDTNSRCFVEQERDILRKQGKLVSDKKAAALKRDAEALRAMMAAQAGVAPAPKPQADAAGTPSSVLLSNVPKLDTWCRWHLQERPFTARVLPLRPLWHTSLFPLEDSFRLAFVSCY